MKAWLITWEWMSDSVAVADKIAGVIDPRRSSSFVLDFVEYLRAKRTASTIVRRGSLEALHAALRAAPDVGEDEPDWSPFGLTAKKP